MNQLHKITEEEIECADGFVWREFHRLLDIPVRDLALWYNTKIKTTGLFRLHDDGAESLIESLGELTEHIALDGRVGEEIGYRDPPTYMLAFYEMDRAYGGPEEGGWWFDCGQLVRTLRTYDTRALAEKAQKRANALLDRLQRTKRSTSSMAYTGGRHSVLLFKDVAPDAIPTERPSYE